ncbi:MAG: hypothetical protein R3A44_24870 [Caldilineaceae bacterium]
MCIHRIADNTNNMTLSELYSLIRWDLRINAGLSWDSVRAMLLLVELRCEQFVYSKTQNGGILKIFWFLMRGFGSIFQWFICNSNIPGSTTIGRGLRLPHPQNIIVAAFADIGEFCTIYHNVSIAWNGFKPTVPHSPTIGARTLLGAGAIIIGDIDIGTNVLIGAGAVVSKSIPDNSTVTSMRPEIRERLPSEDAAQPGSARHLTDPYSIWR